MWRNCGSVRRNAEIVGPVVGMCERMGGETCKAEKEWTTMIKKVIEIQHLVFELGVCND